QRQLQSQPPKNQAHHPQRQADPHPQSPRGQHRLPDDKSPLHPPGQLQLQNQKLQLQLQHPQNQKLQCLLQCLSS
ncbi:unnamed protein product, partial [Closterium sp. NIES-53]